MQRATAFAHAFVSAKGSNNQDNWINRQVADRLTHTNAGIVHEPTVNIHLTKKTRLKIVGQALGSLVRTM